MSQNNDMAEPLDTKEYVALCQKKIAKWQKRLNKCRDDCTHPGVQVKHRGNTGNYDPMNDCYWTEHFCPVCGKFWKEEKE